MILKYFLAMVWLLAPVLMAATGPLSLTSCEPDSKQPLFVLRGDTWFVTENHERLGLRKLQRLNLGEGILSNARFPCESLPGAGSVRIQKAGWAFIRLQLETPSTVESLFSSRDVLEAYVYDSQLRKWRGYAPHRSTRAAISLTEVLPNQSVMVRTLRDNVVLGTGSPEVQIEGGGRDTMFLKPFVRVEPRMHEYAGRSLPLQRPSGEWVWQSGLNRQLGVELSGYLGSRASRAWLQVTNGSSGEVTRYGLTLSQDHLLQNQPLSLTDGSYTLQVITDTALKSDPMELKVLPAGLNFQAMFHELMPTPETNTRIHLAALNSQTFLQQPQRFAMARLSEVRVSIKGSDIATVSRTFSPEETSATLAVPYGLNRSLRVEYIDDEGQTVRVGEKSFDATGPQLSLTPAKVDIGIPEIAVHPQSGAFLGSVEVSLESTAPIVYTTDGSDPRSSETALRVTTLQNLVLTETTSVQAYAEAGTTRRSAVFEYTYLRGAEPDLDFIPLGTFDASRRTFVNQMQLEVVSNVEGTRVACTLNGSTPNPDQAVTLPLTLTLSETSEVRCVGKDFNGFLGAEESQTWIQNVLPALEVSPSGEPHYFAEQVEVLIDSSMSQAEFSYTTDAGTQTATTPFSLTLNTNSTLSVLPVSGVLSGESAVYEYVKVNFSGLQIETSPSNVGGTFTTSVGVTLASSVPGMQVQIGINEAPEQDAPLQDLPLTIQLEETADLFYRVFVEGVGSKPQSRTFTRLEASELVVQEQGIDPVNRTFYELAVVSFFSPQQSTLRYSPNGVQPLSEWIVADLPVTETFTEDFELHYQLLGADSSVIESGVVSATKVNSNFGGLPPLDGTTVFGRGGEYSFQAQVAPGDSVEVDLNGVPSTIQQVSQTGAANLIVVSNISSGCQTMQIRFVPDSGNVEKRSFKLCQPVLKATDTEDPHGLHVNLKQWSGYRGVNWDPIREEILVHSSSGAVLTVDEKMVLREVVPPKNHFGVNSTIRQPVAGYDGDVWFFSEQNPMVLNRALHGNGVAEAVSASGDGFVSLMGDVVTTTADFALADVDFDLNPSLLPRLHMNQASLILNVDGILFLIDPQSATVRRLMGHDVSGQHALTPPADTTGLNAYSQTTDPVLTVEYVDSETFAVATLNLNAGQIDVFEIRTSGPGLGSTSPIGSIGTLGGILPSDMSNLDASAMEVSAIQSLVRSAGRWFLQAKDRLYEWIPASNTLSWLGGGDPNAHSAIYSGDIGELARIPASLYSMGDKILALSETVDYSNGTLQQPMISADAVLIKEGMAEPIFQYQPSSLSDSLPHVVLPNAQRIYEVSEAGGTGFYQALLLDSPEDFSPYLNAAQFSASTRFVGRSSSALSLRGTTYTQIYVRDQAPDMAQSLNTVDVTTFLTELQLAGGVGSLSLLPAVNSDGSVCISETTTVRDTLWAAATEGVSLSHTPLPSLACARYVQDPATGSVYARLFAENQMRIYRLQPQVPTEAPELVFQTDISVNSQYGTITAAGQPSNRDSFDVHDGLIVFEIAEAIFTLDIEQPLASLKLRALSQNHSALSSSFLPQGLDYAGEVRQLEFDFKGELYALAAHLSGNSALLHLDLKTGFRSRVLDFGVDPSAASSPRLASAAFHNRAAGTAAMFVSDPILRALPDGLYIGDRVYGDRATDWLRLTRENEPVPVEGTDFSFAMPNQGLLQFGEQLRIGLNTSKPLRLLGYLNAAPPIQTESAVLHRIGLDSHPMQAPYLQGSVMVDARGNRSEPSAGTQNDATLYPALQENLPAPQIQSAGLEGTYEPAFMEHGRGLIDLAVSGAGSRVKIEALAWDGSPVSTEVQRLAFLADEEEHTESLYFLRPHLTSQIRVTPVGPGGSAASKIVSHPWDRSTIGVGGVYAGDLPAFMSGFSADRLVDAGSGWIGLIRRTAENSAPVQSEEQVVGFYKKDQPLRLVQLYVPGEPHVFFHPSAMATDPNGTLWYLRTESRFDSQMETLVYSTFLGHLGDYHPQKRQQMVAAQDVYEFEGRYGNLAMQGAYAVLAGQPTGSTASFLQTTQDEIVLASLNTATLQPDFQRFTLPDNSFLKQHPAFLKTFAGDTYFDVQSSSGPKILAIEDASTTLAPTLALDLSYNSANPVPQHTTVLSASQIPGFNTFKDMTFMQDGSFAIVASEQTTVANWTQLAETAGAVFKTSLDLTTGTTDAIEVVLPLHPDAPQMVKQPRVFDQKIAPSVAIHASQDGLYRLAAPVHPHQGQLERIQGQVQYPITAFNPLGNRRRALARTLRLNVRDHAMAPLEDSFFYVEQESRDLIGIHIDTGYAQKLDWSQPFLDVIQGPDGQIYALDESGVLVRVAFSDVSDASLISGTVVSRIAIPGGRVQFDMTSATEVLLASQGQLGRYDLNTGIRTLVGAFDSALEGSPVDLMIDGSWVYMLRNEDASDSSLELVAARHDVSQPADYVEGQILSGLAQYQKLGSGYFGRVQLPGMSGNPMRELVDDSLQAVSNLTEKPAYHAAYRHSHPRLAGALRLAGYLPNPQDIAAFGRYRHGYYYLVQNDLGEMSLRITGDNYKNLREAVGAGSNIELDQMGDFATNQQPGNFHETYLQFDNTEMRNADVLGYLGAEFQHFEQHTSHNLKMAFTGLSALFEDGSPLRPAYLTSITRLGETMHFEPPHSTETMSVSTPEFIELAVDHMRIASSGTNVTLEVAIENLGSFDLEDSSTSGNLARAAVRAALDSGDRGEQYPSIAPGEVVTSSIDWTLSGSPWFGNFKVETYPVVRANSDSSFFVATQEYAPLPSVSRDDTVAVVKSFRVEDGSSIPLRDVFHPDYATISPSDIYTIENAPGLESAVSLTVDNSLYPASPRLEVTGTLTQPVIVKTCYRKGSSSPCVFTDWVHLIPNID